MAKTNTIKPQDMTPSSAGSGSALHATPDGTQEDNRLPMAPRHIFEITEDTAGVVLNSRGRARVSSALSAIDTLAAVLFQRELDHGTDHGLAMSQSTAIGLLQALGVCSEFVSSHINGGGTEHHYCTNIDTDEPAYQALEKLQRDAVQAQQAA